MAEQPDTQPKPTSALEAERYKANEAHILELLRATIALEEFKKLALAVAKVSYKGLRLPATI